ncbi:MAG: DNA polymerase III subunit beta [Actinobacteria bacterium]|nr:DNA polymerase III subunit beta [Actinomycetota bacterium]
MVVSTIPLFSFTSPWSWGPAGRGRPCWRRGYAAVVRLTCSRDELASRLALASRAASSKGTIPVLANVLLRAEEGVVELAATDMEVSVRVPLEDAGVEEHGAVVLPRLVVDLVRSMAPGPVALVHNENEGRVQVSGGGSSFNLNCHQAEEYPELPPDGGAGFSIPADRLTTCADRVVRAASRDETRPVLTGVLVRIGPEGLTMAATDSYRLAVRTEPLAFPPAEPQEAIVPARAVAEVSRLAAQAKERDVEVALTDSRAAFRCAGVLMTARLIEGQFPDYRQLIPAEFEQEVRLDRAEFLAVLTRIGMLAQRTAPLRLSFERGQLTVATTSDQVGEGREPMPAPYAGEPMEIGFNADFLREGVEGLDGDEVRLGLISPLRPGLLRGEGDDYRYLLMPIRLPG